MAPGRSRGFARQILCSSTIYYYHLNFSCGEFVKPIKSLPLMRRRSQACEGALACALRGRGMRLGYRRARELKGRARMGPRTPAARRVAQRLKR
ncbi:MAG: hypothetical protein JW999_07405 [Methanotrichaceae archaeon]|nr:hypothetical protein [Methanotrichaceae archaeon]